jgi:hypothetical protein
MDCSVANLIHCFSFKITLLFVLCRDHRRIPLGLNETRFMGNKLFSIPPVDAPQGKWLRFTPAFWDGQTRQNGGQKYKKI